MSEETINTGTNVPENQPTPMGAPSAPKADIPVSAPSAVAPAPTTPQATIAPQVPKAAFELPKAVAPKSTFTPRAVSQPFAPGAQPASVAAADDSPSMLSVGIDFIAAAVAVAFAVLIVLDI